MTVSSEKNVMALLQDQNDVTREQIFVCQWRIKLKIIHPHTPIHFGLGMCLI